MHVWELVSISPMSELHKTLPHPTAILFYFVEVSSVNSDESAALDFIYCRILWLTPEIVRRCYLSTIKLSNSQRTNVRRKIDQFRATKVKAVLLMILQHFNLGAPFSLPAEILLTKGFVLNHTLTHLELWRCTAVRQERAQYLSEQQCETSPCSFTCSLQYLLKLEDKIVNGNKTRLITRLWLSCC